jgi:prepilin-type N-terminal cleavage/methylation domain-containing protein
MRIWASESPKSANSVAVTRDETFGCSAVRPLRRTGFTLIEILIAMGIFSMVLAAIYSSWTAILRGRKVGLDAAAAVQRARIAGRTIEECLGSVQSFVANQPYYSFVAQNGSEATLSFVTRLSPSFPRSGKFGDLTVRRVTFTVEQGKDGSRDLVLRQNPLMMDVDVDEKNYPLILAKNVKEFKTEFWDMRLQDWIDEWKQTNQLPVVVKVSLKLAPDQYSSQVREQITRIVNLPSVAVQPAWQVPRMQGLQPNQQLQPGQQVPPGQQLSPGQINTGQQYPGQQQTYPGQQFPIQPR